jgi:predicted ribonuclease YlaK
VDSEAVPVVETNETLSCVIESTLGTSFNKSSSDFATKTTTLIAHLYKGMTEEDTEHAYYYEWYEINTAAENSEEPVQCVLERLTVEEIADDYESSDAYNGLTSQEKVEYLNKTKYRYRGAAGSHEITLKLSELQNKSIYFIAYPGGAPSTGGSILGIARLGVMPLGK